MKLLFLLLIIPTIAAESSWNEDKLYAENSENITTDITYELVTVKTLPTNTKPTRFIDKVRAIGRKQSVGVKGTLMCAGVPVRNATIKLWDNDMLDPDDLIAETQANSDGTFELSGFVVSITTIDPQIRIYHNCRSTSRVCRRKITFTVPENYITKGMKPAKFFNLGTPNMEIGVRHKEEPYCY